MNFEKELRFTREVLKKSHIQSAVIDPREPFDKSYDATLSAILIQGDNDAQCFNDVFPNTEGNVIYKVSDAFACRYLFMRLPNSRSVLTIGPYVVRDLGQSTFLEWGEEHKLDPTQIRTLAHFYARLPLVTSEESYLMTLIDTLGEQLWGAGKFNVQEIQREQSRIEHPSAVTGAIDADSNWTSTRLMEERYDYENQMMEAISQGQLHKAEQMLSSFSTLSFESRAADPIRNLKNYCIITNTLFRKAAQNGGVHPIHLDALSSEYAKQIEMITAPQQVQPLMAEMFRSYCRLVRERSVSPYSPTVQKVMLIIDTDITADLSLSALARQSSVSAGYLSALFHREVGETLTAYVNQRRVEAAKKLLRTTRLQIQTVAQHCGIVDVHYFTKIFKNQVGVTPKEYRQKGRR